MRAITSLFTLIRPAAAGLAVLLLMLHSSTVLSQDINALKAAYIFYFSKFVTWQQQIDDQIVVCLDTTNKPLIHQLQGLEGKPVADKRLHIRTLDENTEAEVASHCHILYSDMDAASLSQTPHQVLIVTDRMEPQSIIAFQVNDGKLSFEIDANRAEANNLYISSKLLQLAGKVYR